LWSAFLAAALAQLPQANQSMARTRRKHAWQAAGHPRPSTKILLLREHCSGAARNRSIGSESPIRSEWLKLMAALC